MGLMCELECSVQKSFLTTPQNEGSKMANSQILGAVLVLLVAAGGLNFFDHRKNQTKAEAMTFVSWFLIVLAIAVCIYGLAGK